MSTLDRIGRYAVERRLGSGAFALVWLGQDDMLEAPVAIKVLAENWAHQLDLRARFVEEARLLRRADSDRVVRVFDIGDLPDGRPYFVMTFADRGTLAERLTGGATLPVRDALLVAAEIARGVAVLHGLGVIHRDLKPSNVLFRSTVDGERLLIADLGLAKAVAHASGFTVAAGSPGYMAPEQQVIGGGIDVRVDVYGIGAVAYRMLTGVVPEAEPAGPTPPSALRDGLPSGTDSVVGRALERDRERRWPSARLLADALDELADRVPAAADDWADDDEPTVAYAIPPGEVDEAIGDGAAGEEAADEEAADEETAGEGVASDAAGEQATADRTDPPTMIESPANGTSPAAASTAVRAGQADPPTAVEVRGPAQPGSVERASAAASPGRVAVQRPARAGSAAGSAASQRPPGRPAAPPRPAGRPRSAGRRWPWVVALSLLGLAAVAAGGFAVLLARQPTTVHDRSNRIAITVPAAWSRQLQGDGWSPRAAGLGSETSAAGLAVSADLSGWRDPATGTPGVFVGLSRDRGLVQKVGRIPHAGCTKSAEAYRDGPFTGTIFRHACPGAASFTEVGLTAQGSPDGVYVQIKQQPGTEDHTAAILGSLQVGG